jgi:formylglycine-generating enzyme required for sulfatase activity
VGSYSGSPSPYGTFDQGGNLWEWNEAIINASTSRNRGTRGGGYNRFDPPEDMASSARGWSFPVGDSDFIGFRLATTVPEPSTGLLVFAGLLSLTGWRRARA